MGQMISRVLSLCRPDQADGVTPGNPDQADAVTPGYSDHADAVTPRNPDQADAVTLDLLDQADAVTPNVPTPMVCHCLCSMPPGAEAASSFFYSARIAELRKQRSEIDNHNQLKFDVESSTSHWTSVTAASVKSGDSDDSNEQVRNKVVFEKLKEHPEWGPFFRRHPYELKIGAKIAEGGQAEIFEAIGMNKYDYSCKENENARLVLKVFKEGFPMDQLQRLWPPGMASATLPHRYFQRESYNPEYTVICWALGAQLMEDGRFAYIFDRYWGDLRKLIDEIMMKRNGCPPFSAAIIHRFILSIARSMCDLHKLGILHNDLKAANVLVQNPGKSHVYVVVADFESSVGIEGTGFWRALEILLALKNRKLQQEPFIQQTSQQTDVYSFAMTCYEVITGRMPFEGHDVQDDDIILRGERPTLPSGPYYSMYNDMLMKCWHQDPGQRPSFVELVKDLEALDYKSWPKCSFRGSEWW